MWRRRPSFVSTAAASNHSGLLARRAVAAAAACPAAAATTTTASLFLLLRNSSRNYGCTVSNTSRTTSRNAGLMPPSMGASSILASSRTAVSRNTILAAAQQDRPSRFGRFTRRRIGGGGFSRLLDLGGAPSSLHDDRSSKKRLNLNKNCHLQAVIFDFDVLTRSVEREKAQDDTNSQQATTGAAKKFSDSSIGGSLSAPIQPDTGMIEQVAGLLNIDLSGNKDKPIAEQTFEDDLSLLTGEAPPPKNNETKQNQEATIQTTKTATATAPSPSSSSDIRSKYAAKLQSAGLGGLSAVDRAKHEVTEGAEHRGDAAGHFAARKLVATSSSSSSSSSRWMAATGTGKLLNYLHQRSMKLALVGTPVPEGAAVPAASWKDEARQMNDFTKQMKDKVVFAATVQQDGTLTAGALAQRAIQELLSSETATIAPDRCLWVSDRDDCLRAAREAGLVTVRVRPKNARRGNVSAHYNVASVPETQEVINEINGISFKTVVQQGA